MQNSHSLQCDLKSQWQRNVQVIWSSLPPLPIPLLPPKDLTSWKIWCVICLSLIERSSSSLLLTSFRDMWNSLEPPNLLLRSMGITILKNGYFEDFDFCSAMYFCIVLLPKVEVKVEVTTQKGSVNYRKGRPENWKTLVFSERYRLRLSVIGRGGTVSSTPNPLQSKHVAVSYTHLTLPTILLV